MKRIFIFLMLFAPGCREEKPIRLSKSIKRLITLNFKIMKHLPPLGHTVHISILFLMYAVYCCMMFNRMELADWTSNIRDIRPGAFTGNRYQGSPASSGSAMATLTRCKRFSASFGFFLSSARELSPLLVE